MTDSDSNSRGPPEIEEKPKKYNSGDRWPFDMPVLIWSRLDQAQMTKTQMRLIEHLCRSVGLEGHWKGIRSMAETTRTHPTYCRLVLSQLINYKLVLRQLVPGRSHIYKIAPIAVWRKFLDARDLSLLTQKKTIETLEPCVADEFWTRLGVQLNCRELRLFTRYMRTDPEKWERVMADVENRRKRGLMEGADKLEPLEGKDCFQKYFSDTWKRFPGKADKKKSAVN